MCKKNEYPFKNNKYRPKSVVSQREIYIKDQHIQKRHILAFKVTTHKLKKKGEKEQKMINQ